MFTALKKSLSESLMGERSGKSFALTTRDKDGNKLKKPIPLTRPETIARLAEINKKIGNLSLIANKAVQEAKQIDLDSSEGRTLAKKCTMALEHCAKTSLQNDFFYGSIETCEDPSFMDRKHAIYGARLDEIATTLSSILKRICKD